MFKFIVGLVAFIIAGCAAYFSVQGLATLYSGKFIAVCIMAGSLEIGKLVSASFLKRYWKKTSFILKLYLMTAVFVLMGITSLGIFGFLTASYQESHVKVELVDSKRNIFEQKKISITDQIKQLNDRIATLNEARASQEKRLPQMSRKSAEPIYADIKKSGEEISSTRSTIDKLTNELNSIDTELISLKIDESKHTDIGTLKFVATLFDVSVEEVVKWFTIAIVCVFDPLAVALVLAYNSLIAPKNKEEKIEEEIEEIVSYETTEGKTGLPINYRDKV